MALREPGTGISSAVKLSSDWPSSGSPSLLLADICYIGEYLLLIGQDNEIACSYWLMYGVEMMMTQLIQTLHTTHRDETTKTKFENFTIENLVFFSI